MTRYTPWVVSEHAPDFSTLEAIVKSRRFDGLAGQDLAVALWQLMVDRDLGIFHYCPAQEALWGKDCHDPLKILNVYGFTICHVHANVLAMLGEAAGFRTRIANVTGHEGTEFFYDDAWHYFDADLQMFHRLRPPDDTVIASREQLHADPTLVSDQPNPSRPYHIPDRLPENFAAAYAPEPDYPETVAERVHSMDYHLRPGESMTRWFHHRGRWVVFPNYPEMFTRYRAETGPEGPTERFWPRRQWGNGCFEYAPDLTCNSRDVECGADEIVGLETTSDGLTAAGETGSAVFAFESPYIYCGIPDPMRRVPAADGATLEAAFDLPDGASAAIEGAAEGSDDFRQLWTSARATGSVDCKLDFTDLAEARYRLRLRLVLSGKGAVLRSLLTRLWFMVSPHSLPALRNAGDNRMTVHSGDRYGLPTRPLMIEIRTDDPDWSAAVCATRNLRHDPETFARIVAVDPSKRWEAIYELPAPAGGRMAWATAYALIEARKPDAPAETFPATIALSDSPDGPWTTIAERPIAEHPRGWHFALVGEGGFPEGAAAGYVRFSAPRGAAGFRTMGHYVPADADTAAGPLEIEHAWYEDHEDVGRRLHTHTETITTDAAEYVVHCEREPHDESITLRIPSTRRT